MAGKTATVIVRVETGLDEEAIQLLTEIRDRLPVLPETSGRALDTARRVAKRAALAAVMNALDGWIRSVRDEHHAMGHKGESRGDECWRRFAPGDIRLMINDAAREVGIAPFILAAHPSEDQS
jgi:hypothetical protein